MVLSDDDISSMAEKLSARVETQLGVSAKGGLSSQLRRTGRRAPRWIRRNIRMLVEAEAHSENPRLVSRIPYDDVSDAYDRTMSWLSEQDPAARRRQALRGALAAMAFNFLLAAAIAITALALLGIIGPGAP